MQFSTAQNLIQNADFESYSGCPTGLGQVDSCTSWHNVVASSDYYNCSFLVFPTAFPTTPVSYSGTGWMAFASYGDANGSAEAIGQVLPQPLLPGNTYHLSYAVKKTNGGPYSDICGGLAVYGSENTSLPNTFSTHISQNSDFSLLGTSNTLQDTVWISESFSFTCADTVNSIVFTVAFAPSCSEYVFLDSLNLYSISTSVTEVENETVNVFPNPVRDNLNIQLNNKENTTFLLYDITGKKIIEHQFSDVLTLNLQQFSKGIYFYELKNSNSVFKQGKVIKE